MSHAFNADMPSVSCQHMLPQVCMNRYLLCRCSHGLVCKDQAHAHDQVWTSEESLASLGPLDRFNIWIIKTIRVCTVPFKISFKWQRFHMINCFFHMYWKHLKTCLKNHHYQFNCMDAFFKSIESRERKLWEHSICCLPSNAKIS